MHQNDCMDEAKAWDRWLTALADPACPMQITLCGRYRLTGWDMGRRVLSEHMLHLVHQGGQHGSVAGRAIRTGPGDVLWVPAGCEQILRQRGEVRWFAKANLRFTIAAEPPPLATVIRGAAAIAPHLDGLRREWSARLPDREPRLRALLVLLFSELRRVAVRQSGGLEAAAQARLLELVDRDPTARPQPTELARQLGLSPNWFSRLFRRTYGCAPRAWLVNHRIARAAGRLESAATAGEVAAEFGYRDLFLFSRQFRKVMGLAPRAWLASRRRSGAGGPAVTTRGDF